MADINEPNVDLIKKRLAFGIEELIFINKRHELSILELLHEIEKKKFEIQNNEKIIEQRKADLAKYEG